VKRGGKRDEKEVQTSVHVSETFLKSQKLPVIQLILGVNSEEITELTVR
jgi:hypothetical protein